MNIKIKAENYRSDNDSEIFEKNFSSLEELQNYMFDIMEKPYRYKDKSCKSGYSYNMYLPTKLNQFNRIGAIKLLYSDTHNLYIESIKINGELHFSSGKFNNNNHVISNVISDFMEQCNIRMNSIK